jgi:hypothetical protein
MKKDRLFFQALLVLAAGTTMACASTQKEPAGPEAAESDPEPWAAIAPKDDAAAKPAPSSEGEASEVATNEPEFRPGMTVTEATNAVPSSAERLNIEQERLAEPLMEPKLYEPCSLQGHHHFSVKVAVWDGKAVGLDVTTKPQDEKLATCLRQQIEGVEWEDKAKSLNTVEYSY